jgi:hypothetical protein
MSLLSQLKRIPIKYPFAFGMGISTFKTSFSDLLVQSVIEKKEQIDWKRNLAFASFGCFYLGGVQYALYVPIFGRMFPNAASFAAKGLKAKLKDAKGQFALGAQVFLDQCVHHPLMYFPVFYMTKVCVFLKECSVEFYILMTKNNVHKPCSDHSHLCLCNSNSAHNVIHMIGVRYFWRQARCWESAFHLQAKYEGRSFRYVGSWILWLALLLALLSSLCSHRRNHSIFLTFQPCGKYGFLQLS